MAEYLIEQKVMSVKPRFSIYDAQENEVLTVEGRALRVHEQLAVRDTNGQEVAFIKHEGALKTRYQLSLNGVHVATLTPKRKLLKTNFILTDTETGQEIVARGNFSGYEYTFERNGSTVASVKKTRRWRDRYQLDIGSGEDELLFISSVLAIDAFQVQEERRAQDQRRQQQ